LREEDDLEKIKITEVETHPLCPHCGRKLDEINWHKVRGVSMSQLGYVAVYSCPHCRKFLATSANMS
jgi:uncharacterized protein with PIN domain